MGAGGLDAGVPTGTVIGVFDDADEEGCMLDYDIDEASRLVREPGLAIECMSDHGSQKLGVPCRSLLHVGFFFSYRQLCHDFAVLLVVESEHVSCSVLGYPAFAPSLEPRGNHLRGGW